MAPTIQTEVVYGHRESVGVTVSALPIFPVQHLIIFCLLDTLCLQHALIGIRPRCDHYPWSMYRFTRQFKT